MIRLIMIRMNNWCNAVFSFECLNLCPRCLEFTSSSNGNSMYSEAPEEFEPVGTAT